MGADLYTINGKSFYGYTVTEIQKVLNEMLVECHDQDKSFDHISGAEWAYITIRQKLGLSDYSDVEGS